MGGLDSGVTQVAAEIGRVRCCYLSGPLSAHAVRVTEADPMKEP